MDNQSTQDLTPNSQAQPIQIIYFDEEAEQGAKGPLGSLRRRVEKIGVLDFASFGNNLQEFCNCISGTLQSVVDSVSQYSLHSFKLTIEVTAKSEVRLIGSAGTEVKGGLKLIFQRKQ
jgi:hypothetical protein